MMGITMNMKRSSIGGGLVALMMTLAACQSESPTAPSGGNPPPTGGSPGTPSVAITLAVSNSSPLISTASTDPAQTNATITATVTQAGGGVPNGTAVEFSTNLGTFTDTGTASTVKTTTNGVASATLTSTVAGTALVRVRVNDASQTTTVTFRDPSANQLGITGISPATGSARGGTTVTITGRNFQGPLRVLFGNQEATIVSFNATSITVLTPPSGSTTFGSTNVVVTVISLAGTPNEQRTSSAVLFTYTPDIVTPVLASVAPSSGPNEGNTRIVILGDGFQTPLRAYFGTDTGPGPLADQTELEVLQVTTNQIIALTPPALGFGAALLNQQVVLRVHNIASNTEAILDRAFRYGPVARITAIAPGSGSAFGGTSLTIDGGGFDDPVAVSVAGIAARVIRVSGTQILVITNPTPISCNTTSGPVTVTNIEDGSTATGPTFTYAAVNPVITNVSPTTGTPGSTTTVTVFNPGVGIDGTALIKFTIAGNTVFPSPSLITDPRGPIGFSLTIPSNVTFPSMACMTGTGAAGTQMGPLVTNVVFTNATTGCTDTSVNAFSITPSGLNPCVATAPPTPGVLVISPPGPIDFGAQPIGAGPTAARPFTLSNTGGTSITVINYNSSNPADFPVTGPAFGFTIAPGASQTLQVTFDPSTVGAKTSNLQVTISGTPQPAPVVLTGTGT